jgi:sulfur relay (sulfurtransferase) DsrC/TusE family protein
LIIQKETTTLKRYQYEIVRTLRNKWKVFKKTPTRIGKKTLTKHQKLTLWGASKRRHKLLGGKKF